MTKVAGAEVVEPLVVLDDHAGAARRSNDTVLKIVAPTVTFVLVIVAVQLLSGPVVSSDTLPEPTDVGRSLVDDLQTSALYSAIGVSLKSWATGLLIAVVTGIPIGMLAGRLDFAFESLRFVVDFLRPIPPVALLPLLILLLGVTADVTVALAAIGAFFPLFFAALYGSRDIDPVKIETARVYRIGRVNRIRFINLPGTAPYISTGLRLAATVALLLVVGTELVIGVPGLGNAIGQAELGGNRPMMFARIVVAGALGLVITLLFMALDKVLLRWHESQRGDR